MCSNFLGVGFINRGFSNRCPLYIVRPASFIGPDKKYQIRGKLINHVAINLVFTANSLLRNSGHFLSRLKVELDLRGMRLTGLFYLLAFSLNLAACNNYLLVKLENSPGIQNRRNGFRKLLKPGLSHHRPHKPSCASIPDYKFCRTRMAVPAQGRGYVFMRGKCQLPGRKTCGPFRNKDKCIQGSLVTLHYGVTPL